MVSPNRPGYLSRETRRSRLRCQADPDYAVKPFVLPDSLGKRNFLQLTFRSSVALSSGGFPVTAPPTSREFWGDTMLSYSCRTAADPE